MPITNSQYQILVDAKVNTSTIQTQLNALGKNYKGIDLGGVSKQISNIGIAAKSSQTFTDSLYSGLRNFNNLVNVIQGTVQVVESLTSAVFELNEAQTEFKKVSDLTGSALDEYTEKASKLGDSVARTSANMISAATEFRKSSYNDEDSLILAKTASLFQNVADSTLSAGDAASVIISQMKAFNITAEDSTKIIDVINEVSNNYAVSSTDLTI